MGDIHVETLAGYQTNGAVYCYGYGAMRQLMQSLDNGSVTIEQYIEQTKSVISAVEFRTAEIMAEVMIETGKIEARIGEYLRPVQSQFPNAIDRRDEEGVTPPYSH